MKKAANVLLLLGMLGFVVSCAMPVGGDSPAATPAAADTVSVTGVSINKQTLSLAVGADETLTATIAPTNASVATVAWSSDHPEIASVDASSGKVTGVAVGSATITVTTTDGNKTETCAVTITAPVAGPPAGPADTKVVEKTDYTISGYSAFAADGSERSYFGPDAKKTLSEKTKYYRFWFSKGGKDYIVAADGSMVECSDAAGHYLTAVWDNTTGWIIKKEGAGGYSVTL